MLAAGTLESWRAAEGMSPQDVTADRFVVSIFSIWFALVPLAIWMAVGQPPEWLAVSVTVALWVYGGVLFFTVGLGSLLVPFFLICLISSANRKKAEQWKDPQEELEEGHDEWVKFVDVVDELKKDGSVPDDLELPPKSRDELADYLYREFPDHPISPYHPISPDHPVFSRAIWIAGIVLIVALLMSGRPILAAVYASPWVGWLAIEGFKWIMLSRQAS